MSHHNVQNGTHPTLTQMKATIIILPPFLHSCRNVAAEIETNAFQDVRIGAGVYTYECGSGSGSGTTDTTDTSDTGSCCQQGYKNYGKHAMANGQDDNSNSISNNNNNDINNNTFNNMKSSTWRSRDGREHRKNMLHARCGASSASASALASASVSAPLQHIKMTALDVENRKRAREPIKTATTTSSSIRTNPTRTGYVERSSSSISNDGDDVAVAVALAEAIGAVAVAAAAAAAAAVAVTATAVVMADGVQMKRDRSRLFKTTNPCLADSLNLSNSQLVMPIEDECSRLVGNMAEMAKTSATTWRTQTPVGAAPRAIREISQTTTLECRCFKKNAGDITDDDHLKRRGGGRGGEAVAVGTVTEAGDSRAYDEKLPEQRLEQRLRQQAPTSWSAKHWWLQMVMIMKMQMTDAVSKFFLMALMMLMLTSRANCWAGRQDASSNCTFPARWEGSWFLSGYQQSIHIKGSQFSYRGKCAASDGNKYLIVDEKGCHRCLVIYEKHKNVLQYKESECEGDSMYMHQSNPSAMAMRSVLKQTDHRGGAHPNLNGHSRLSSSDQYIMRSNDDMNDCPPDFCKGRETLQNLCDQIPGDALLYSLFRENAEPVKCPLKGPFIFTYNRGHGECKNPVSNIESCTEDSRLLLSFQACPDVQGTESTVEELTCLATWKDGNSRYLVGLVSHHHAISNEERYRCFVYEKINSLMGGLSTSSSKDAEYKLAQSGDATCNGLDSAEVGSRIMSLRKPPLAERCDFPVWFKGPRHWHALMGNAVYNYHSNDGSIHIIKSNGYMETRALCEQINKQTSTEMMAVVHYTTGCQSGFMCMMFYRRDTHVIEIQTGKQASRLEDACAPDHFDINRMSYITLLASNPDPQICPMEGLYNLRGAIGPPYLTTRHKRNHNNKVHLGHNHHHQGELGNSHKRHVTLSFRNAENIERGSWHANTRGLPVRSRRDAASTTSSSSTTRTTTTSMQLNVLSEVNVDDPLAPALHLEKAIESKTPRQRSSNNKTTSVGFISSGSIVGQQRLRSRRDAPACVTNYKAQRRLWVGCTAPNVIDVRPLCNDDGDEEYSCHGSWSENGTVYIIARHKGTKHGVCVSYRPTEGTSAKLVIGDGCYRGTLKPPEHHLVANLSVFGKCGDTGSASSQIQTISWLTTLFGAFVALLLGQWNGHDTTGAVTLRLR